MYTPLDFAIRGLHIGEVAQFLANAGAITKQRTPAGPGQPFIVRKLIKMEQVSTSLDAALGIDRKSQVTQTIEDLDATRDRYFSGIKGCCKLFRFYPDSAVVSAAAYVSNVLRKYGDINHMSYPDQTARLRSLAGEMASDQNLAAAVAKVPGLAFWMQQLQVSNEQFDQYYLARVRETAALPNEGAVTLRKPAADTWSELQTTINAFASDDEDGSYTSLYQELRALINQYRDIRARREGLSGDRDEQQ